MQKSWMAIAVLALSTGPVAATDSCGPSGPDVPRLMLALETKANPPRVFGEGTSIYWPWPGETIELLCLAAPIAGVAIDFRRVPWSRGLHLLEFDRVDGLFHASFTAERQRIGVYPMAGGEPDAGRALFTQSYHLYVTDGSTIRWDGERLEGLGDGAIGIGRGYSVATTLRGLGARVDEEDGAESNFRKLLAGRIAGVVELEDMADAVLRVSPDGPKIHRMPIPVQTRPYFLLFSRGFVADRPRLAERFRDALHGVATSGSFAAVREKYESLP